MPRRQAEDATQVFNILKFRGALGEFDIVAISDCSFEEAANRLRESAFFFSFSGPEGFGLPPAEAMASGCITIGFHGRGGKEYFCPDFSWPIAAGDIEDYARTAETVLARPDIATTPRRSSAKRPRRRASSPIHIRRKLRKPISWPAGARSPAEGGEKRRQMPFSQGRRRLRAKGLSWNMPAANSLLKGTFVMRISTSLGLVLLAGLLAGTAQAQPVKPDPAHIVATLPNDIKWDIDANFGESRSLISWATPPSPAPMSC